MGPGTKHILGDLKQKIKVKNLRNGLKCKQVKIKKDTLFWNLKLRAHRCRGLTIHKLLLFISFLVNINIRCSFLSNIKNLKLIIGHQSV